MIFRDDLDRLAAEHPDRLEVHHHLDNATGFLDAEAIRAFVGATVDADFYVCGPGPFMDLVETTLLDAGVDADRIAIERFVNAGQAAAPPVDAAPVASGAEVPDEVTVILKGKRHSIPYRPGDTLLETARRGGLSAPFSCEAGNCATCMALLHDGSATMRTNNALTEEEVAEGWILTCQGVPEGAEVTVEYESF